MEDNWWLDSRLDSLGKVGEHGERTGRSSAVSRLCPNTRVVAARCSLHFETTSSDRALPWCTVQVGR